MDKNSQEKRKRGAGDSGRCVKDRSKKRYSKKRKHHGKNRKSNDESLCVENVVPQDTVVSTAEVQPDPTVIVTASSSKIIDIVTPSPPSLQNTFPRLTGYRLIDISILDSVFQLLCCPECYSSTLRLDDKDIEKKD